MNYINIYDNRKPIRHQAGSMLLVVLMFVCILAIWVLAFNRDAFQVSWVAFRSEHEEIVKHLIEGAVDEAYVFVDRESRDPESPTGRWLSDSNDNRPVAIDLSRLPLTKAAVDEFANGSPAKISSFELTVSKRNDDFRNNQNGGTSYYGHQCHGSLAFNCTINVSRANAPFIGYTLEQHHDYKVVNLVSSRQSPAARANAFNQNLDYVLYVRDGFEEFKSTRALMLNRAQLKLAVRPRGKGRIYFGGTNLNDYVFLNIDPGQSHHLPPLLTATRTLNRSETDAMVQAIFRAAPGLRSRLVQALNSHEAPTGMFGKTPEAAIGDLLADTQPELVSTFAAIDIAADDPQQIYVQAGLFDNINSSGNYVDNMEPGISLLEESDDPAAVLEGGIRKRFIDIISSDQLKTFVSLLRRFLADTAPTDFLAALSPDNYRRRCSNAGEQADPIVIGVDEALAALPANPLHTTVSRIDDELPYGTNAATARKTQLLPRGLAEAYMPFQYRNLRSFSVAGTSDLETLGMLESGRLKPHGAVFVRSDIVLGENGPVKCEGCGIISCNGDIIIKNGISCEPGSLLILSGKGRLVIQTSEPIEAAITAQTVVVDAAQTLNLKGSLWVEKLGSANWPVNREHSIEYDVERLARDKDLNLATISPRVTFMRLTRSDQ